MMSRKKISETNPSSGSNKAVELSTDTTLMNFIRYAKYRLKIDIQII